MAPGGIAHVGRQNRRRKVDTLRPFIDTVAHARTAHGNRTDAGHANYREDVGRKLGRLRLRRHMHALHGAGGFPRCTQSRSARLSGRQSRLGASAKPSQSVVGAESKT